MILKQEKNYEVNTMKVEVRIKNKDWQKDLQESAMNTINKKWNEGKELTEELFRKYLLSEHSPIRGIELRITLFDIPYFTSVHFARHIHSIPYVTTNRPDRTGRQERSTNDTCTHMFDINIQGLIDMMRKRLCSGKCDAITFKFALAIKKAFIEKGNYYKVIGEMLVPNCIYRGGCPEFSSCGFYEGNILKRYEEYNQQIIK